MDQWKLYVWPSCIRQLWPLSVCEQCCRPCRLGPPLANCRVEGLSSWITGLVLWCVVQGDWILSMANFKGPEIHYVGGQHPVFLQYIYSKVGFPISKHVCLQSLFLKWNEFLSSPLSIITLGTRNNSTLYITLLQKHWNDYHCKVLVKNNLDCAKKVTIIISNSCISVFSDSNQDKIFALAGTSPAFFFND